MDLFLKFVLAARFRKNNCPCKEGRGGSGSHNGMQNVLSL